MKCKIIRNALLYAGLIFTQTSLFADTIVQYNFDSQTVAPSFVSAGISNSTPLSTAASQATFYSNQYLPWMGYGYSIHDNNGSSVSFTVNTFDGIQLSLTNLSFEHFENQYNENGGIPNIAVSMQLGNNAPVQIGLTSAGDLFNPTVYSSPTYDLISIPLGVSDYVGSITFNIGIGAGDVGYGSPILTMDNLSLFGSFQAAPVPEPSTVAMIVLGVLSLISFQKRKR